MVEVEVEVSSSGLLSAAKVLKGLGLSALSDGCAAVSTDAAEVLG